MVENNEIENNSSMGSGQTPEFPELDNNLPAEDLGQETSANATDLEETQENPVGDGQAPVPAKKTKKTGRRWVWASILAMLVLLIAGVLIGSRFADWAGLALGVGACGIGYLILRIVEKKSKQKNSFQPRMTRILEDWE